MFKKLLSVLAVVASTSPALAYTSMNEGMVERDILTSTLRATGTVVLYDDPMCDEDGAYGGYQPAT